MSRSIFAFGETVESERFCASGHYFQFLRRRMEFSDAKTALPDAYEAILPLENLKVFNLPPGTMKARKGFRSLEEG